MADYVKRVHSGNSNRGLIRKM